MEIIWTFHPTDRETYLRILNDLVPILDREGFSFHVCRPPARCTTGKPVVKRKALCVKGVRK